MHKLTVIFENGDQRQEEALWLNANAAKLHAEEQLKFFKRIHMIRINPLDGSTPINVIRPAKG